MTTAQEEAQAPGISRFDVDTTDGSWLHRLAVRRGRRRSPAAPVSLAEAYLLAVLLTYVPLLIFAALGSLPLWSPAGALKLPFLRDWNVAFMFLISFPALVVLTLSDQPSLEHSIHRVQQDGVLIIDEMEMQALSVRWRGIFRWVNYLGQALGVGLGLVVATANYFTYRDEAVGFWIAANGGLLPVGYVFLACVAVFFLLIPVYVLRSIAISLLLRDLVTHAQLRILPLHPDRCGGLRPVGRLGLRNQYALSVYGVNVVLLVAVSIVYLNPPIVLYYLIGAAAVAYLIVGPIVFMGPLLPFRSGMLRLKQDLMSEVAQRLRRELTRIREQLASGQVSRDDEELVDRLRKIGAVIDELPVWPFDAGTLRTFLTVYVVPAIGAAALPLTQWVGLKLLPVLKPLLG